MTSGPVSADHLVATIREQAEACGRLGSPLYLRLLHAVANDVEAGGVAAQVLAGHERDPGPDVLGLRLAGAVHRLVLQGRAPALAAHYPSVGGTPGSTEQVWSAFRDVLGTHRQAVRALLAQPPQTNEVGRGAALVGGLMHLAARFGHPVRLLELGASAGLLLRADHYRYAALDGKGWGPPGSPVVIDDAWRGTPPPADAPLRIVERAGADTAPVDPTSPDGRLTLTSYVWPDQLERLRRLRGALAVAAEVAAPVLRCTARQAVAAMRVVPGTTTVVWHSVMWQYLDGNEQLAVLSRLEWLGGHASEESPLAHLALEPRRQQPGRPPEFVVTLRTWPGGEEAELAVAHPHGPPVRWTGWPR